ncbi:DUF1501 domain-containing protein [Endozoicomonas sp. SCSIO W0465]|uniref:DUF1501 domain-containing protein n=1 Tax=Endozoicomonas sp. SCSIO W0465 TaxID=2918516 RepID=UPI002076300B|nr:DUF1501 domain-containing protein [Endozoicomonas sp. SCSIO W0465]USE37129.1 DUF1501 domain-containing protein [Endozoicomonas sp. SCSIO W0465]
MTKINRRDLIKWLGAGVVCSQIPVTGNLAFGQNSNRRQNVSPKLVWIVLRGAMDSLHAVLPAFDDHLLVHRRVIAEPALDAMLPLERGFGLNNNLATLHGWYRQQQMVPVVAVASPYRQRSHFEGQDVLESGLVPMSQDNGWLSRAREATGKTGLSVSHSLPVSLRGGQQAGTWYPNTIPSAKEDLYRRLFQIYQQDDLLHNRLEEALDIRGIVGSSMDGNSRKFKALAEAAGTLLSHQEGPDAIMLEMGGWDTHDNQLARLSRQFQELDSGLQSMRASMGEQTWSNTIIMIATEFGRTVALNGTGGTDHGTASCLFIAGGAVNGGKVLGDWPGLARKDLYEARDLRPTSDIRQWISAVLVEHWQLSAPQLMRIFPDVTPARMV